jgi:hypothetical protein
MIAVTQLPVSGLGRARQLCPGTSDLDFLRNLDGIIDLNAEISNRTLNFRMAQQKLDSPQVAGSAVDERRLGPPQRVGAELQRVQADAGDPLANQPSILASCQTATCAPWK